MTVVEREQRLVERAERAERALLKTWITNVGGLVACELCGTDDGIAYSGFAFKEDVEHEPGCIIPALESRYE